VAVKLAAKAGTFLGVRILRPASLRLRRGSPIRIDLPRLNSRSLISVSDVPRGYMWPLATVFRSPNGLGDVFS